MGVVKEITRSGDGVTYPVAGDNVQIYYTGYLREDNAKDNLGNQFDTTDGRGPFKTQIGVGKVIKGWDEGVVQMTLGEKAILNITSDYGYGNRGFPGLIPAASDLIFYVELIAINTKTAASNAA
ncbi:MAG: FK506-binding protein 2B [Vezdaea aestivalis]|nr:MAG: FK506-binding protein 2B [Vezdaea aestivalis]